MTIVRTQRSRETPFEPSLEIAQALVAMGEGLCASRVTEARRRGRDVIRTENDQRFMHEICGRLMSEVQQGYRVQEALSHLNSSHRRWFEEKLKTLFGKNHLFSADRSTLTPIQALLRLETFSPDKFNAEASGVLRLLEENERNADGVVRSAVDEFAQRLRRSGCDLRVFENNLSLHRAWHSFSSNLSTWRGIEGLATGMGSGILAGALVGFIIPAGLTGLTGLVIGVGARAMLTSGAQEVIQGMWRAVVHQEGMQAFEGWQQSLEVNSFENTLGEFAEHGIEGMLGRYGVIGKVMGQVGNTLVSQLGVEFSKLTGLMHEYYEGNRQSFAERVLTSGMQQAVMIGSRHLTTAAMQTHRGVMAAAGRFHEEMSRLYRDQWGTLTIPVGETRRTQIRERFEGYVRASVDALRHHMESFDSEGRTHDRSLVISPVGIPEMVGVFLRDLMEGRVSRFSHGRRSVLLVYRGREMGRTLARVLDTAFSKETTSDCEFWESPSGVRVQLLSMHAMTSLEMSDLEDLAKTHSLLCVVGEEHIRVVLDETDEGQLIAEEYYRYSRLLRAFGFVDEAGSMTYQPDKVMVGYSIVSAPDGGLIWQPADVALSRKLVDLFQEDLVNVPEAFPLEPQGTQSSRKFSDRWREILPQTRLSIIVDRVREEAESSGRVVVCARDRDDAVQLYESLNQGDLRNKVSLVITSREDLSSYGSLAEEHSREFKSGERRVLIQVRAFPDSDTFWQDPATAIILCGPGMSEARLIRVIAPHLQAPSGRCPKIIDACGAVEVHARALGLDPLTFLQNGRVRLGTVAGEGYSRDRRTANAQTSGVHEYAMSFFHEGAARNLGLAMTQALPDLEDGRNFDSVAARLGMSVSALRKIIEGKLLPSSRDQIIQMAEALGLDPQILTTAWAEDQVVYFNRHYPIPEITETFTEPQAALLMRTRGIFFSQNGGRVGRSGNMDRYLREGGLPSDRGWRRDFLSGPLSELLGADPVRAVFGDLEMGLYLRPENVEAFRNVVLPHVREWQRLAGVEEGESFFLSYQHKGSEGGLTGFRPVREQPASKTNYGYMQVRVWRDGCCHVLALEGAAQEGLYPILRESSFWVTPHAMLLGIHHQTTSGFLEWRTNDLFFAAERAGLERDGIFYITYNARKDGGLSDVRCCTERPTNLKYCFLEVEKKGEAVIVRSMAGGISRSLYPIWRQNPELKVPHAFLLGLRGQSLTDFSEWKVEDTERLWRDVGVAETESVYLRFCSSQGSLSSFVATSTPNTEGRGDYDCDLRVSQLNGRIAIEEIDAPPELKREVARAVSNVPCWCMAGGDFLTGVDRSIATLAVMPEADLDRISERLGSSELVHVDYIPARYEGLNDVSFAATKNTQAESHGHVVWTRTLVGWRVTLIEGSKYQKVYEGFRAARAPLFHPSLLGFPEQTSRLFCEWTAADFLEARRRAGAINQSYRVNFLHMSKNGNIIQLSFSANKAEGQRDSVRVQPESESRFRVVSVESVVASEIYLQMRESELFRSGTLQIPELLTRESSLTREGLEQFSRDHASEGGNPNDFYLEAIPIRNEGFFFQARAYAARMRGARLHVIRTSSGWSLSTKDDSLRSFATAYLR